MDRKQQLEAMGMACVAAWQGRMAAVQSLPDSPLALLQDALPSYRSWLAELAQMHGSWVDALAGNGALLDSGMPWHWLEMGGGLPAQVHAGTAQVAQQETRSQVSLPISQKPMPSPPASKGAGIGHGIEAKPQGLAEAKSLERAAVIPPDSPSKNVLPLEKQASKEEDIAEWPLQEKPVAQPQQVIFRGLQDFAAFVQTPPTPLQHEGSELSEKDSQRGLGNVLENAAAPQAPKTSTPAVLETEDMQLRKLEALFAGLSTTHPPSTPARQESIPPSLSKKEKSARGADFPIQSSVEKAGNYLQPAQGQTRPKPISVMPSTSEQGNESIPPNLERDPLPTWEQIHTQWEQLSVSQSSPRKTPVVRPPMAQVQKPPLSDGGLETTTEKAQKVEGTLVNPSPSPTEIAPFPASPWPAWPSKTSTQAPALETTELVSQFMEAMTEQLQRDFKRYYGA